MPESYFKAVAGWQSRRFGWHVSKEWIVPVTSVIAALKTLIHAFSRPGDSVLIQPPVGHNSLNSLNDSAGRAKVHIPQPHRNRLGSHLIRREKPGWKAPLHRTGVPPIHDIVKLESRTLGHHVISSTYSYCLFNAHSAKPKTG
ncbi:protein of unknown function (plasmid) [Cupriavidus taiwanensis]|uniref:Uncharacterized protein n=1 Tax=Cupriavidus taiwanensis TaxID=164546 RepID=A0A375IV33_9BURK|nr:protein of unknown function [Cupriavidus taiwanensis]